MPHDTLTCAGNIDRLGVKGVRVVADHELMIHCIRTELVARQWIGEEE